MLKPVTMSLHYTLTTEKTAAGPTAANVDQQVSDFRAPPAGYESKQDRHLAKATAAMTAAEKSETSATEEASSPLVNKNSKRKWSSYGNCAPVLSSECELTAANYDDYEQDRRDRDDYYGRPRPDAIFMLNDELGHERNPADRQENKAGGKRKDSSYCLHGGGLFDLFAELDDMDADSDEEGQYHSSISEEVARTTNVESPYFPCADKNSGDDYCCSINTMRVHPKRQ